MIGVVVILLCWHGDTSSSIGGYSDGVVIGYSSGIALVVMAAMCITTNDGCDVIDGRVL